MLNLKPLCLIFAVQNNKTTLKNDSKSNSAASHYKTTHFRKT